MADPKDEVQAQAEAQAEEALSLVPALGAIADTEAARVVAQVQAAALLARTHPRDVSAAVDGILDMCGRLSLAHKASYVFRRGGEEVNGPTIRLAEAVVQMWGNMRAGIDELSRDVEEGVSVCRAFATDMQNGNEDERKFMVRHWRDVRGGKGYRVTSERDIREVIANMGQRNKRACIQAIVPAWVFEEAIERCEQTLHDNIRLDEQAIESMLNRFAEIGVMQEHIEAKLNCPLHEITAAQMIHLHKVFNAIKGGDATAAEWFDLPATAPGEAPEAKGNTLADVLRRGQRKAEAKAGHSSQQTQDRRAQDIERRLTEARTLEELTAASVGIGPLTNPDDKERLYALWDERQAALKKGGSK